MMKFAILATILFATVAQIDRHMDSEGLVEPYLMVVEVVAQSAVDAGEGDMVEG